MGDGCIGRRAALLGSMAAVAAGQAGAHPAGTSAEAKHAPLRAAFLAWLAGARGRSAVPMTADTTAPSHTELHLAGVHPAIWVSLTSAGGIDVGVEWDDEFWDLLTSEDVFLRRTACGGWQNASLLPEYRVVHPTRESAWCAGFETLLDWINGELASATHLALWRSERGGCTWAKLVRDGRTMRGHLDLARDRPPVHLLPVHGWTAGTRAPPR